MSDSNENVSKKAVSRRSVLKWAGALAAVGVVGVGLGFGGDLLIRPNNTTTATKTQAVTQAVTQTATQTVTTTSVQQPTTLSYIPPLSPSVQSTVQQIVQNLVAIGNGEQVYRVTPGLMGTNLVKVHVKNGVLTRVEPDWGDVHPNSPIEDQVATKAELYSGWVQPRGCQMSYAIQAGIYAPDRILYPMQRTPGSTRANLNGSFVRITWQQALDTIAAEITKVQNTYGLYSIFTGTNDSANATANMSGALPTDATQDLLRYTGAGVSCWGHCSGGNEDLSGFQIYGQTGGQYQGELGNVLNTKFIVFWGNDPAETGGVPWQTTAYYFALAHESGIPAIYIGPRESMTAEVLADQWIPIRPGTDVTMMLAVANVLFKENLYDQTFVAKYVEPTGFTQWKNYVLGVTAGPDGAIDRTPAWAAPICGVPAETIQAFAELYGSFQGHANGKPAWLMFTSGGARAYKGEQPTRVAAYLQWMTGNIGISGGNLSYCHYSEYDFNSGHAGPAMNYNRISPEATPAGKAGQSFAAPALFKEWKWADAVLLRPQVANGQLSLAAYNQIIGSAATNPPPNLKFVFNSGSTGQPTAINGQPVINKALQAIAALDMYVFGGWHWTPEAKASDIVLPFADFFEYEAGFGSLNEALGIAQSPKLLTPQGEAMPMEWVRSEIANRLGFGQYYNAFYGPTGTAANWDSVDQQALQNGFTAWNSTTTANAWGITLPSTLAALKAKGFLLAPSQTVGTTGVLLSQAINSGNQIIAGAQGKPFWTTSGLAEFYSNFFANPNLPQTKFGGTVSPMGRYEVQPYGMFDPTQPQYPLALIECHPRARGNVGSCDSNPLAGGNDIFRHSVWMNPADAQSRGIVDNDMVHVTNNIGDMVLPAYVTSRIVPGVVHIFAGAWFNPDTSGVDQRGSSTLLMHDDYAPVMEPYNSRVEVSKL
ncbi:MAG: molybdopterin-dependent oxidoreductase [Nitrososphaerales archaeon]